MRGYMRIQLTKNTNLVTRPPVLHEERVPPSNVSIQVPGDAVRSKYRSIHVKQKPDEDADRSGGEDPKRAREN